MIKIKDYFSFNSRERLAIILLCCLMGLFWILPAFYPDKSLPIITEKEKPRTEEPFTKELHPHEFVQPNAARNFESYAAEKPEPARVISYFYFDPNTIDANQWQKLGLRPKTINTILNYRNKGGQFRKPDDLRKIWGLKPEDADQLVPFVQIVKASVPEKEAPKYFGQSKDSLVVRSHKGYKNININSASQSDWESFPGIGPVLASRIIKYRDKMGGFKTVEQVGKTYGIPDSVFQKILPYLEKKDLNEPEK
jgi:competence ComEA-like helix-hairpin-helix protein